MAYFEFPLTCLEAYGVSVEDHNGNLKSSVNYKILCVQIGDMDVGNCDGVVVAEINDRIVTGVRALEY